jgi:type III secretory pathway component EscV
MKEDYLWDKTGAVDPEIQRLENALTVFRYQETEPPALPAKIIPFERKTPRGFFRLAFAFAACAALAIISLGVWLQISNNKVEIAKNSTETIAPQIDERVADETSVKQSDDSIVEKVEIPEQPARQKITKIRKVVQPIARQNKLIAQNVEVKKPTVKLTKEEKFAYDQLMLALSITSSKFKMVKDKVEGVEEQNEVRKNGR